MKMSFKIEYVQITCVVMAYWAISISMVFANKWLLGSRDSTSGDVSIFVAWVQCVVVVVLLTARHVWRRFTNSEWGRENTLINGHPLSRPILALTITYVGMLTFNNMCLKHVGVAFYQVARSLTLIFVVMFSALILKMRASRRVLVCCVFVAGGFVLGVDQESLTGTLSLNGLMFGIITSLFVSLSGIFTKTALASVDRDSVRLTYYNNINASVFFIPFVLVSGQLTTVLQSPEYHTLGFWAFLLATGGLSFLIAWISALQIDLTSPTTHHISANAKAVLQTLIAVVTTQQHKPLLWWMSILMVVGGALMYAMTRIREDAVEKQSTDKNSNHTNVLEKVENGLMSTKPVSKGRDRSNTA